jgi:hypothetical protein
MPTPNMNLDLPVVSTTLGPEWASLLTAALELVDAHDHSSGKGSKITPAGILINALFDLNGQNLTDANSYGIENRASADTSNLGSLQRLNNNLYWITPSGASVQITSGSTLSNAGLLTAFSPGSYPYTLLSTDTAKVVLVNTTSARTLNLPAASEGEFYYYIKDATGSAQTNNITIAPNGSDQIENVNSNFLIDYNNGSFGIISDGISKWAIF